MPKKMGGARPRKAPHAFQGIFQPRTANAAKGNRAEAKQRDEEARVWLSGLEAIAMKIGVRTVYDLSVGQPLTGAPED